MHSHTLFFHFPAVPLRGRIGRKPGWPWLIVLFGCLALRVLSGEPPDSKTTLATRGFHAIPLQFKEFKFSVDAKLNGAKCSTIIDTGSTFTLIDISRAKKARPFDPQRDHYSDPLFSTVLPQSPESLTNFCILDTLDFPGIQVLGTPALLNRNEIRKQGELTSLQRFNQTVAYASLILGTDFLVRHRAIIACHNPASMLLQASPEATNTTAIHRQLTALGYQSVPLLYATNSWRVEAEVEGVSALLLLDTGAPMTLLDPSFADGLHLQGGKSAGQVLGMDGKKSDVSRHLIQSLKIGQVHYSKVFVHSSKLKAWGMGRASDRKPSGLLGMDMLAEGRAIIDCANHRLYMLPPPSK